MFKTIPQIPIEGFYYHTPDDDMVRNAFIEITAPEPPKRKISRKSRPRLVMRWKVFLLGHTSIAMKGVCSTLGYKDFMPRAAETLAARAALKDPSYGCFYGLVDMKGRPYLPRARCEVPPEIDVGDWPDYRQCGCPECVNLFGSTAEGSEVEIMPAIVEEKVRVGILPFHAVAMDSLLPSIRAPADPLTLDTKKDSHG